jgi:hypothetical protein
MRDLEGRWLVALAGAAAVSLSWCGAQAQE